MKQIFTYLFFVLFATNLSAQITIDRDNFPLQASYIDTFYISNVTTPVALPTTGADQTWDYSMPEDPEGFFKVHSDASGSTVYPEAFSSSPFTFDFQGFGIPTIIYEGINDDKYFEIGRTQLEAAYSISAITGGPNDTLRFVNEEIQYEGQIDRLIFPVAFEEQWTTAHKEYFPFELTVAAFGLNNTPGRQSRERSQIREVAGYGDLIILDRDGNPANPVQTLLIKMTETRVDSTFLGGQPAPPALMAAFGLEQGAVEEFDIYLFYMPGFGTLPVDVGVSGRLLYRPQATDLSTGINDVFTLEGKAFPNPIAAGQNLNFQLETPFHEGICRITDLTGKVLFETAVNTGGQSNFSVQMPTHLNTGLYLYQLETDDGELMRPRIISIN